jgi:cell division protein FtsL
MATAALNGNQRPSAPASGKRALAGGPWRGTPEIFFSKAIDNSRLVRQTDPKRRREMAAFVGALALLFALFMVYAWQHFSAIEYGYRIEKLRSEREALMEENRQLKLQEASLRDPERIDQLAQKMGLKSPEAGQVMRMEPGDAGDNSAPVMARVAAVSVISAAR